MALHHPDLCWNGEHEYTSCIHLEGEALMNALRSRRGRLFRLGHEHSLGEDAETPADIETEADTDAKPPQSNNKPMSWIRSSRAFMISICPPPTSRASQAEVPAAASSPMASS